MANKKKKEKLVPPAIVYIAMEDDGDIYLSAYESLADAAADSSTEKPIIVGTYQLIETQKVRTTFEVVK